MAGTELTGDESISGTSGLHHQTSLAAHSLVAPNAFQFTGGFNRRLERMMVSRLRGNSDARRAARRIISSVAGGQRRI